MELLIIILLSVSIFFSVISCIYKAVCHSMLRNVLKSIRSVNESHKETLRYLKARDSSDLNNIRDTLELKMVKLSKIVSNDLSRHKETTAEHIKLIYKILKGAGDGSIQPEEIVKMIDGTGILQDDELDKIMKDSIEEVAKKDIQYVGE